MKASRRDCQVATGIVGVGVAAVVVTRVIKDIFVIAVVIAVDVE